MENSLTCVRSSADDVAQCIKMAKTTTDLDKLIIFLKLQEDFNFTILQKILPQTVEDFEKLEI